MRYTTGGAELRNNLHHRIDAHHMEFAGKFCSNDVGCWLYEILLQMCEFRVLLLRKCWRSMEAKGMTLEAIYNTA